MSDFTNRIPEPRSPAPRTRRPVPASFAPGPLPPRENQDLSPELLDQLFSRCFTDLGTPAAEGELPRLYGRDEIVAEVLRLLASPLARHPLLIGRPGVGKTVIAQAVAERVRRGDCPEPLRGLRLVATSFPQLWMGLPENNWRSALYRLWERLTEAGPCLLLLHDIHDAPHYPRVAEVLEELLQVPASAGSVRVLAEARADRWSHIASGDDDAANGFVQVSVPEPHGEALSYIIGAVIRDLEVQHGMTVTADAQKRAVDLTDRYVVNIAQPGKALALIEETMARAGETSATTTLEIGADDVLHRFAQRTQLRLDLLDEQALWNETNVRDHFQRRVLGQELAIEAVVQRLTLLKAAIHDVNRPLGVFLFFGPTGVGKTELAKALASFLFGRADRLVRFNMSDVSEAQLFGVGHSGAPLDVQRGQLTTRIGDQVLPVVLLDEFEKADGDMFQRFLQLFDEGVLLNGAGEQVNLRNSLIILTSNLAANLVYQGDVGFTRTSEGLPLEQRAVRRVEEFYTPEFINRIDQIVFFHPLSRATIRRIAARELHDLFRREGVLRRQVELEFDDSVVDWILDRGYSQRFGARYLRRQMEKLISYPLAQALVTQPVEVGSVIRLYVQRGGQRQIKATVLRPAEESKLFGTIVEVGPARRQMTMAELKAELPLLRSRLERAAKIHNLDTLRLERDNLLAALSRADFWEDEHASGSHMRRLGAVSTRVELMDSLLAVADEAQHLLEDIRSTAEHGKLQTVVGLYHQLLTDLERAELDLLFVDHFDPAGAWITLTAGDEDAASSSWVVELVQMYLGWAKGRHFEAVVVDESGVDTTTPQLRMRLRIDGYGAFALLRGESGVHRLVEGAEEGGRAVRQARVLVWPQAEATSSPLPGSELRVRSSGTNGRGRFLKRLRSQIEVTHIPSGAIVRVTTSLAIDAAERLALELMQSHHLAQQVEQPVSPPAVWGDVVRSYQRHREQGARDLRTDTVVKNLRQVLAGRIDPLLMATLLLRTQTSAPGQN